MEITDVNPTSLWGFISENMTTWEFEGYNQKFLPKRAFDNITERSVIEKIIFTDKELSLGSKERAAFVTKVYEKGPKLFVTCVYSVKPMTCLEKLLNGDVSVSDEDFPLPANYQLPRSSPSLQQAFTAGFLHNQQHFNAPLFLLHSFQELNDDFPIPIKLDENDTNLRGRGSFGTVWEIEIHKDHHNFNCGESKNHRFAMKVIQQVASQARERKFIEDTKNLEHDHLVKCLSSWTFGAKYYMIYELATSNLEEFIQKHPSEHPGLTIAWFIKQLCGLAGALRVIHNQHTDNKLGVPRSKSGYIHDIKPENILVFVCNDKIPCFCLSDFGCAKVVDFIASISGHHEMSYATTSKSGTPNYRPPEAREGQTSRPYDLWSLGCVYLELLVWFLQGCEALKAFRADRRRQSHFERWEDEAFFKDESGAAEKAKLRDAVLDKMAELKEICHTDLASLLDVVTSLLCIEPKDRLDAAGLVEKLKHLNTSTSLDSNGGMAQTPDVPVLRTSASIYGNGSNSHTYPAVRIHSPTDE